MLNIMLSKYKNLSLPAKASLSYTIANFISKGVGFITIPIFTRLLTTAEIGVSTTYSSWYSLLYPIFTLSLTSGSLNIAMMDYKDKRDKYESACLTLTSLTCIIAAVLFCIFHSPISRWFSLDETVCICLFVSSIFNPALDMWYARQRYEYKYKSSVIVSVLVTILTAVISIFAIKLFYGKVSNLGNVRVIAQSIVLIAFSLVFFIYIMGKGKCFFDIEIWKYALPLSLPLIAHSLAKSILDLSDRLMISSICGKSEAGIYGTIYSLSMVSLIVWNAINTSLVPLSFEKLEKGEEKSLNKTIISIILFFAVAAVGVTLLAPEILKLLTTDEYYKAVSLVPAISAGVFFTALYNVYGNFLLYKKKTTYIMLGTVISAIFNIITNYIFIKLFGYIAAAYTTLASNILLAFLEAIICRCVYKKEIINDSLLFSCSLCVAIICLMCNLLYKFSLIRYCMVLLIIIISVVKRDRIRAMIGK